MSIYGIDLGTTYSAISFVDDFGQTQIIPNSDNERITPSVVFFEESTNRVLVGTIAKELAITDPDRVVSFIKREMSNDDYAFPIDDKEYTPAEISSLILKGLVGDVAAAGHEVRDVVITCPAYFGASERERTRQAGVLAGLNVIEILDEPVAAAIHYGQKNNCKGINAIVYDLGGGTFDVTVVKFGDNPEKNEISVICTEGNHQLGGKDWDDKIMEFYAQELLTQKGKDIFTNLEAVYELRINAERDKQSLSRIGNVNRRVDFEGESVVVTLTREKFEDLTKGLMESTLVLTDNVIEQAKSRGVEHIDMYLLVGGSTRMSQVKRKLAERYHLTDENLVMFEVDEAVAKGAARAGTIEIMKVMLERMAQENYDKPYQSLTSAEQKHVMDIVAGVTGRTSTDIRDITMTNMVKVATKSYGIRIKNEDDSYSIHNLITKQTQVPMKESQVFGTAGPNSTLLILEPFMNNEPGVNAEVEKSILLGQAEFPLNGTLPERAPIEVTFELDNQGLLKLTALDQTNNESITASFKSNGVMSEVEMTRAMENLQHLTVVRNDE